MPYQISDYIPVYKYDSNRATMDSADLQVILGSKFPYIATPIWCQVYDVLHPTLMRNLVDWVFLTHQLCRGIPPTENASTQFRNISVVNNCVELVFTNIHDAGKIY